MINTCFKVADNSGVEQVLELTNLTRKEKRVKIGDLIVGVIKKVKKHSIFRISSIIHAIIVRTKQMVPIKGRTLKFNDNSLVLVDKNYAPLASRIFGTIPLFLKHKGCLKLNSITVDFI